MHVECGVWCPAVEAQVIELAKSTKTVDGDGKDS